MKSRIVYSEYTQTTYIDTDSDIPPRTPTYVPELRIYPSFYSNSEFLHNLYTSVYKSQRLIRR